MISNLCIVIEGVRLVVLEAAVWTVIADVVRVRKECDVEIFFYFVVYANINCILQYLVTFVFFLAS